MNDLSKTSKKPKITGYGICGPKEKYLKKTLDCFKSLCDEVVIVGNNIDSESVSLIKEYGFELLEDNREWGIYQNKIKEDLMEVLAQKDPEWLISLDMDEVLLIERDKLEEIMAQTDSIYAFVVNLWSKGWKKSRSFWNIRAWKWNGVTKFLNRPLHCGLAPEWAYHYGSYCPVILLHYGLKDKSVRQRKIKRYEQYDPKAKYCSAEYYNSLHEDNYDELDLDFIQKEIERETLPIVRKNYITVKKEFVYVEREDGKVFDIPKSQLEEHLKRGFKLHKEIEHK